MNKLFVIAVAFCGLVVLPVNANEAGEKLYQACVACHGRVAEGSIAQKAPALAGQQQIYLLRQLQHFKNGIRGAESKDTLGAQMKAMAATLPDEQALEAVAAYLSDLPTTVMSNPQAGDLRNGKNYYHASCGGCHGGKAEGNTALNAPRLVGLSAEYIKRQYQNFQQGLRGGHPDDRYGRQMKLMSNSLPTAKDLVDVTAFIQSQGLPE